MTGRYDAILARVSLKHEEVTYRRVQDFVLDKGVRPHLEHEHYPTIAAKSIRITVYRDAENDPWYLWAVTISGMRVNSDGLVGRREGSQPLLIDREKHEALDGPEWVRDLAMAVVADLEKERTGLTSTSAGHRGGNADRRRSI